MKAGKFWLTTLFVAMTAALVGCHHDHNNNNQAQSPGEDNTVPGQPEQPQQPNEPQQPVIASPMGFYIGDLATSELAQAIKNQTGQDVETPNKYWMLVVDKSTADEKKAEVVGGFLVVDKANQDATKGWWGLAKGEGSFDGEKLNIPKYKVFTIDTVANPNNNQHDRLTHYGTDLDINYTETGIYGAMKLQPTTSPWLSSLQDMPQVNLQIASTQPALDIKPVAKLADLEGNWLMRDQFINAIYKEHLPSADNTTWYLMDATVTLDQDKAVIEASYPNLPQIDPKGTCKVSGEISESGYNYYNMTLKTNEYCGGADSDKDMEGYLVQKTDGEVVAFMFAKGLTAEANPKVPNFARVILGKNVTPIIPPATPTP